MKGKVNIMSANNFITNDKKTFIMRMVDADTGYRSILRKAKNIEDAIKVAEKEMQYEYKEYGIHFTDN